MSPEPSRALRTSPSSSTPMRAGSSAGACRGPRIRASCWMRWNRPCTSGVRCIAAGLRASQRQGQPIRLHPLHGTSGTGRHRALRRQRWRQGKIRRRLTQDPIGLARFSELALQRHDPLRLLSPGSGPIAAVTLGLPESAPQCLRRAADLRRDGADRRPLRAVLSGAVLQHPRGPVPNFRRVTRRRHLPRHRAIVINGWSFRQTGAIQRTQVRSDPQHGYDAFG